MSRGVRSMWSMYVYVCIVFWAVQKTANSYRLLFELKNEQVLGWAEELFSLAEELISLAEELFSLAGELFSRARLSQVLFILQVVTQKLPANLRIGHALVILAL